MRVAPSLLAVLLLAAPALTRAQPARVADSARREIDAATYAQDLPRLRAADALLERALAASPDDPQLLYSRGYALYRMAALTTGPKREREMKTILAAAERALDRVTSRAAGADALALHSAVVGQQIGLGGMMAGMRLGPRASDLMDRAIEADATNPRVWLLHGVSAVYAPAMFGGGLERAEERLRKATTLFAAAPAAPPAPGAPSWGHADAYVWLGQVLEKRGKPAEALRAYERAVELQPGYRWAESLAARARGR
jgi:tetratricopeptide (TPR) repeat protein